MGEVVGAVVGAVGVVVAGVAAAVVGGPMAAGRTVPMAAEAAAGVVVVSAGILRGRVHESRCPRCRSSP